MQSCTSGSRLAILSVTARESGSSWWPLLSLRSWRPLSARLSRRSGDGADRHRLAGNVVQNGTVARHVTCDPERVMSDTLTQSQNAVRMSADSLWISCSHTCLAMACTEDVDWTSPCLTHEQKNVRMLPLSNQTLQ